MILPDGYSDVPAGKIAAVVTHLEMTARAAFLAIPRARGRCAELKRLISTGFATSIGVLARSGFGFRECGCPMRNSRRSFKRRWWKFMRWCTRAMTKASLSSISATPDNARSSTLASPRQLIGSGAARWLMNRALELAWSRPVARVWLHTCTFDHPGAIPFYQRSGFRPFRRQIEITDDPRLDGTAPRHVAKHVPIIE